MKGIKWFMERLKKRSEQDRAGDWQSAPNYVPVRWIEGTATELANHLMSPPEFDNAIEECVNIAYFAMILACNLQHRKKTDGEIDLMKLTKEEQVSIMERQINSEAANFTLMEKMQYMVEMFDSDPEYSRAARDIVRANLVRELPKVEN